MIEQGMKSFLFSWFLLLSSVALAQTDFNVTFRCSNGEIFQVRSQGADRVLLQRGLFQPVSGPTSLTLPAVIAASGAKYSNGEYSVWLKGDQALLMHGETLMAQDCQASPAAEPLTPIRDASSGIVFIPPERWLAQEVKLRAKAGSDFVRDASHQLDYQYQAAQGSAIDLLTLIVVPSSRASKMTPPTNSIELGRDSQRVYFAVIAQAPPSNTTPEAKQQWQHLRTSTDEVRQNFSLYGVVINQAVETISAKVSWFDRALRPGSEQIVELYVQENDKLGELIAHESQLLDKGYPKAVTLRFDPAAINPKLSYVVQAKLLSGSSVVMQSKPQAVLTQGHGREVNLVMQKNR
jgi:membrane-bound inhibitor of C-type lysozyme/uncharacterized lipoprotein YbaY